MTGAAGWPELAVVILTFLTALTGYVQTRRNTAKISEVHVLVNSQLTAVVDRVAQLTGTLRDAGLDIPPEPGAANP